MRDHLFQGERVTLAQIKMAPLNRVVWKLRLLEYMVENLLCKALRSKQGFDTFHPSQLIFFLDEAMDNIVCVSSHDGIVKVRSLQNDHKTLEGLPTSQQLCGSILSMVENKDGDGKHTWIVFKSLWGETCGFKINCHFPTSKFQHKEYDEQWHLGTKYLSTKWQ